MDVKSLIENEIYYFLYDFNFKAFYKKMRKCGLGSLYL